MFMSEAEMIQFTGYSKFYSQREFLKRHRIPFITRRDGFPNVAKDHLLQLLGAAESKHKHLGPLPNFENINA